MDWQWKQCRSTSVGKSATALLVTGLLLVFAVNSGSAQSSSQLLPETTVFHVSVPDVPALVEAFESTDLGKLFDEPALQPFLKDLRSQLENKFADEIQRNGLTLEELKQVDTGEVSFATVLFDDPAGSGQRSGSAFLVEVGGSQQQGDLLLQQVMGNLERREAKRMPDLRVADNTVIHYELKREGGEIRRPMVFCVHLRDWVVVANQQPVMEQLVGSLVSGGHSRPLANTPQFQQVQNRLAATQAPAAAQLTWFAAPFPLASAIRNEQVTPGKTSRYLQAMQQTGFDVIQGVGGDFRFAVDDNEFFFQTFVAVPGEGPLAERLPKAARLLAFEPPGGTNDLRPGAWIRDTAASSLTWYWDSGQAFDAVEPLVDQLYDEGTFRRVVDDIRNAESTQVDLQELARSLGPRWTLASEVVPPLSGTSEKSLIVIEMNDPESAQRNLRNYLKADWYQLRVIEDHPDLEVWEFQGEPEVPDDPINQLINPGGEPEEPVDEEDGLLLGMAVFAFPPGENVILAACDIDYLLKVVQSKKGLVETPAYDRVREKIEKYLPGPVSAYRLANSARAYELAYQLLREGKLPESDTRLEQTLRLLLGTENGVLRKQEIDGSKMPANYAEIVAPHLGPSGWMLSVEPGGWMIVGVGLKNID